MPKFRFLRMHYLNLFLLPDLPFSFKFLFRNPQVKMNVIIAKKKSFIIIYLFTSNFFIAAIDNAYPATLCQ